LNSLHNRRSSSAIPWVLTIDMDYCLKNIEKESSQEPGAQHQELRNNRAFLLVDTVHKKQTTWIQKAKRKRHPIPHPLSKTTGIPQGLAKQKSPVKICSKRKKQGVPCPGKPTKRLGSWGNTPPMKKETINRLKYRQTF